MVPLISITRNEEEKEEAKVKIAELEKEIQELEENKD